MTHFDKSLVKILLAGFVPGEKHYTHHFSSLASSFNGNGNRPLLRKYLRHMEEKGYVINHNTGFNIHKWEITPDGQDALELLKKDYFIK